MNTRKRRANIVPPAPLNVLFVHDVLMHIPHDRNAHPVYIPVPHHLVEAIFSEVDEGNDVCLPLT